MTDEERPLCQFCKKPTYAIVKVTRRPIASNIRERYWTMCYKHARKHRYRFGISDEKLEELKQNWEGHRPHPP